MKIGLGKWIGFRVYDISVGDFGDIKVVWNLIYILIAIVMLSYSILFGIFQYRNPTANTMSYFREFQHVIRLEVLEKYQVEEK
jgi:hypothetical protein